MTVQVFDVVSSVEMLGLPNGEKNLYATLTDPDDAIEITLSKHTPAASQKQGWRTMFCFKAVDPQTFVEVMVLNDLDVEKEKAFFETYQGEQCSHELFYAYLQNHFFKYDANGLQIESPWKLKIRLVGGGALEVHVKMQPEWLPS